MIWKNVVLLFGVTSMLFGGTDAEGSTQRSKRCPYSFVDLGFLSTPAETFYGHDYGHGYGNILQAMKEKITDSFHSLWPSHDSSLDKVTILSPDAVGYEDCPGEGSEPVTCDPSAPYRKFDGTCNNLDHPSWGTSGECQLRLLPPVYEGASGFRKSVVGGKDLPGPRDLSNKVLAGVDRPDPDLTALSVLVGQLLAHDTMHTPTPTRSLEKCCPGQPGFRARPECAPIPLRPDDKFYSRFNSTCMSFERSTDCSSACSGKVRRMNIATAVIDLSIVYGTDEGHADELRTKDGTGKLKSDSSDGQGDLLPRNKGDFSNFCISGSQCFFAGDDRVDQHIALTSLQTVFMREHNRLAGELKQLNRAWEEEQLYQEARKILIGMWQNIVYNEYLPRTLGRRHMTHFGLWVDKSPSYDASVRPGIFIEVSTAGFRLHSQVSRVTGLFGGLRLIPFLETYMRPQLVRSGCVDNILKGASSVKSQQFDRNSEEDINGWFVQVPGAKFGLDSNAIDIQRGRDHGIPSYGETVKFLTGGQTDIKTFDDLSPFMTPDDIKLLRENYESVRDVDLFVGLQHEKHAEGSALGFNSATLNALQFHRLKYGDRFYFEHTGRGAAFTPAQISSLRKSSLSRMFCDNTNLTSIQKLPLLMHSHENKVVKCDEIAKMDLTPWKTNA